MMRRAGTGLMIVALSVMVVEMNYEHPPMGLTQDVDDRGMICVGERNRWRNDAQRVGHDHHGCSQTTESI
jgi:hypothetical protein